MTTKKPTAAPLSDYQRAVIDGTFRLAALAGFSLLDHGDGEVAARLSTRSAELVDAAIKAANK